MEMPPDAAPSSMTNGKEQASMSDAKSSADAAGAKSHRASLRHDLEEANTTPSDASSQGGQTSSSNLLFLNYSSPSEFKSRSNKRIVKRWASTSSHRSSQLVSELDPNTRDSASAPSVAEVQSHDPPRSTRPEQGKRVPNASSVAGIPASVAREGRDSQIAPRLRSPLDPGIPSDTISRSGSDRTGEPKRTSSSRRRSQKSSRSSSDEPRTLRKLLPASPTASDASVNPLSTGAIRAVTRDPFDVLPVRADAHAHELLRLYLDVQLLSPSWNSVEDGADEFKQTLVASRKNVWFPLVRDSTAAFAALVAFIETTPGLSLASKRHGFLEKYQGLALRKANEELASPKTATNDSTLFAIVLLMISAQRTDDLTTFRIHARGLSLLLQQRRQDRRTHHDLTDLEHCFDSSAAARAKRSTTGARRDPYDPRNPLAETTIPPDAPVDFYTLFRRGLVTPQTCYFYAFSVTLLALGLEAEDDQLAASSTAQHIFLESVQPFPAMTPLEQACALAIRLVLHCLVRPLRTPDDSVTAFCVMAVAQGLMSHGVPELLQSAPEALLWLGMAAGSQAKGAALGEIRAGMVEAVRGALVVTGISELEMVMNYLEEHWLWAPTMNLDAMGFWRELHGLAAQVEGGEAVEAGAWG